MRIGILGTGDVGRTLGSAFLALGHEVQLGSRTTESPAARNWVRQAGPRASAGRFAEAAAFGDLLVLATLGAANRAVIEAAGPARFEGKLLIDTTNPLDFSRGFPPSLAVGPFDSGGEQVQRQLPGAHAVKCFNTVGHAHMFRPSFPGGPPDMFICGDSDAAKKTVTTLLADFGWRTIDLGGIEASRYLEAMCLVWVLHAARTGTFQHAFKMLHT
jgi:hypothetical protein